MKNAVLHRFRRAHAWGWIFIIAAVTAGSASGEKVDSTYIQPVKSAVSYSTAQNWRSMKPASGGGILTFANQSADCKSNFNLNQTGVVLGGIDFGDGAFTMIGEALTLSGDGVIRGNNTTGVSITNAVTIPSESTMTKRGRGKVTLEKGFAGTGKLVIAEGTVVTSPGDRFMAQGDIDIRTGHISWYQPKASGDVAVGCGNVSYGPDRAKIVVTKGGVTSYAATLQSLSRNPAGGFLELQTGGSIETLGETEKILVQGRASDDGFIDASVVSRGKAELGSQLHFLAYDAERGFIPAKTEPFTLGQSADGMVAVISEDTTIDRDTAVSALLIENGAQLTVNSGVTLTVGDGVHPAGVIWHGTGLRVRSSDANAYNWKGPGKLQFKEGADGIIYYNGNMATGSSDWTKAPCVNLSQLVLAGDKGVTFAGVANDNRDYGTFSIRDSAPVGWSGGTHILGVRVQVNDATAAKKLPGPVYVLGDIAHGMGGQLRHNQTGPFAQDYYLSGNGIGNSVSHCGIFNWGASPSASFTGKVTLLADAFFVHDNAPAGDNANLVFKGGLTGPGKIVSYENANSNSRIDLAGPSDFTGGVYLTQKAQGVFVTGPNGTPGEGPVKLTSSGSQMLFRKVADIVCSNDYDIAGSITFQNCTNVAFLGSVSAAGATVCEGLRLGVGTDGARLGVVSGSTYARVVPAEEGGVLRIGAEGRDFTLPATLADADDGTKLNVEKVTSDTVTLYGADFSGELRVREGTLKLADDPFTSPNLRYRLDASDDASFAFDENGGVTNWTSVAEPAYSFSRISGYQVPTRTDTLNGRKVVTFSRGETVAQSTWLAGSASCRQQTAVFVVRPRANISNAGLYGQYNADRGLRLMLKTTWNVYPDQKGAFGSGGLYLDGKLTTTGACADNTWQIVTALNSGAGTCPVTFTPSIGSYVTYEATRFFNGDLAEMIVFDRQLDDIERQTVENALAEKWGLPVPHPGVVKGASSRFAKPFAIDVSVGATFDLNGVSVAVASLSGVGAIVNSSDTPVTLTVTGANRFKGKVIGKVTVVQRGAGSVEHTVGEGATLAVDGGATTLTGANGGIVTDGMVYWLDATKADTVLTNGEGRVTNWVSRAGKVSGFRNVNGVKGANQKLYTQPLFEPSVAEWGGRPAVRFTAGAGGIGTNILESSDKASIRTVIFVGLIEDYKNPSGGSIGFWTAVGGERGFFPSSLNLANGRMTLRSYTGTTFHRWGYLQHALGVNSSTGEEEFFDHTEETGTFNSPDKFILISETDDNANNIAWYNNNTYHLGCGYHGPWLGWFGEAIAYDRCLNAEEVRTMEEYLMNKWMRGTPTGPYVETQPVLEEGSGLRVSGGGSVDFGGQAATLSKLGGNDGSVSNFSSLTVEDAFVFNVVGGKVQKLTVNGDLVIGSRAVAEFLNGDTLDRTFQMQQALEVTGEVTGGELKTTVGLPRKWTWTRAGNVWSVIRNGFLFLLR